jgi:steroid 5-alpha reductase family enzyme
LQRFDVQPGFFMSALYLEALGGIAASLSVLMAGAWVVQQRAGNPGWVDTILLLALVGAGSALWPVEGVPSNARQRRYRDRQLRTSPLFPPPPA